MVPNFVIPIQLPLRSTDTSGTAAPHGNVTLPFNVPHVAVFNMSDFFVIMLC